MKWSDLIASSFASLKQRPFRTALTVLGVTIGTMAVLVMVSLGIGMSKSIVSDSNKVTLTQITITGTKEKPGTTSLPKSLTRSAIEKLKKYEGVQAVVPTYSVYADFESRGYSYGISLTGIRTADMSKLHMDLAEGTLPVGKTNLQLVTGGSVPDMMSNTKYETMRQNGIDSLVGKPLFVTFTGLSAGGGIPPGFNPGQMGGQGLPAPAPARRVSATVVGAMPHDDKGFSMREMMIYCDMDALIAQVRRQAGGQALPGQPSVAAGNSETSFVYSSIIVVADSVQTAETLTKTLQDDGWEASSELEFIKAMQRIATVVQAVFGGIGAISLLVAAIGIANTMMMSVYERTKQIGIMKVLGASMTDIRNSFLVESAAIGFLGGVVGLVLSLMISWMMNAVLGAQASVDISVITPWLAIFGVAFATAIGTLAGFIPARRAMNLSPLAAIRTE